MAFVKFLVPRCVLRKEGFDQLSHQRRRQRFVRGKPDRPLAGVLVFHFVLKRFHRCHTHRIERTVLRPRTETDQHPPQSKRRNPLTDALHCLWCDRPNRLAKFLQCGELVTRQRREIFVNGFGVRRHRRHWRAEVFAFSEALRRASKSALKSRGLSASNANCSFLCVSARD